MRILLPLLLGLLVPSASWAITLDLVNMDGDVAHDRRYNSMRCVRCRRSIWRFRRQSEPHAPKAKGLVTKHGESACQSKNAS